MPAPRSAPAAGLVSPWSIQQKLLKAYRRLLLAADLDQPPERLRLMVWVVSLLLATLEAIHIAFHILV